MVESGKRDGDEQARHPRDDAAQGECGGARVLPKTLGCVHERYRAECDREEENIEHETRLD